MLAFHTLQAPACIIEPSTGPVSAFDLFVRWKDQLRLSREHYYGQCKTSTAEDTALDWAAYERCAEAYNRAHTKVPHAGRVALLKSVTQQLKCEGHAREAEYVSRLLKVSPHSGA